MKRPLLRVALLYVGGILAAEYLSLPLWPILAAALCLTVVALGWCRFRAALLYPLLVLAGLANSKLQTDLLSPIDIRGIFGTEPHLVTIRGNLLETPALRVYQQDREPAWRTLARMEVTALCPMKGTWQPASGSIAVSTPGQLTNWYSGQSVEITGVAAQPRSAIAEGTFDYRKYLRRQGVYYLLQAESENDWRRVGPVALPPVADRFSIWARHALALGLPMEDEAIRLEWALALGWKTALTEEVSEPFVRAATYHIFAVDGLRMAIVFGIFYSVLRALSLPRPLCGVVLIPLIWFYVALTGWPASAIRATVMLTIIILGWTLKRPSNPINSLFAAALIILIWEPQQLFQAGFQLSFFVVLCLILTIPPMFDLVKRLTAPDPLLPSQLRPHWHPFLAAPARYVGDLSVTSFAAWVGSLPLVAYYFNIVTPVSTPANILAVPLCVLVLISNLISLVLAAWFPGAAELFNYAGWFGMECIRVSSEWFARWPAAYYYTPAPSLFTTLLYYALLLALVTGWMFRPACRTWKISVFSAAFLIWGWQFCNRVAVTKLTVLPVNGGTTIYCDALGVKRDLLIDVGSTNSVEFTTKPFLRGQGLNRLPSLLLTHGDLHHVGGTEPFLQTFEVSHIFTSPIRFRSAAYRRSMERLGKSSLPLTKAERGDVVAGWTVLHPGSGDQFARADDGAVVVRASLQGTKVLLLSDLGPAGQAGLLEHTPNLRADIVVAGLPAVGEPLGEALIDAIQPNLIIVSDSELPVSERASPKLRARLKRRNIPILFTRDTGAVTLEFRKQHWQLQAMNGMECDSRDDHHSNVFTELLKAIQSRVDR